MRNLVIIVGPTAVGKTATGIMLAKKFQGEIISGDSMQVYRRMDIGTAKVTDEEMEGIAHYLIDIKDPTETYSVAEFQENAQSWIDVIHKKEKLPIIVGGTGLYISALIYGYDFSSTSGDEQFRQEMEQYAKAYGNEALHEKLKEIDLISYHQLHPNNVRRVIRALEVYHLTGKPISNQQRKEERSPYNIIAIGLTMERHVLYDRINKRVDQMVAAGLFEEAKQLFDEGVQDCQSVQAIGYKEIYEYFRGEVSKEEAIERLKRNSRRYAKRQLTWFRNKMELQWFDMTEEREKKLQEIEQFVEGKLF